MQLSIINSFYRIFMIKADDYSKCRLVNNWNIGNRGSVDGMFAITRFGCTKQEIN